MVLVFNNDSDALQQWLESASAPVAAAFVEKYIRNPSNMANFWLYFGIFTVIFPFGLVGNILTLIVMCTPTMRRRSYSVYLLVLSLFDLTMVAFNSIGWINIVSILVTGPIAITFRTTSSCMAIEFFHDLGIMGGSWFIVMISFERLLIVHWPIKSRLICSVNSARIIAVFVTGFSVAFSIWTATRVDYWSGYSCYFPEKDRALDHYLSVIFYFFVPVPLLTIFNICIVTKIFRSKNMGNSERKDENITKVTITMMIVSTVFLICLLPVAFVVSLLVAIPHDQQEQLGLSNAMQVCEIILAVNYCCNFYIYTITGGEIRQAVVKLICPRR
ncbi:C-C chemokine receptor type 2-like [Tubulanus polymorphus]|uniref:C-C chemokine receptor type 2-like n=1 Tax=Tubulanus polymorphus TaxID=672921 RepID=UPI003DA503D5